MTVARQIAEKAKTLFDVAGFEKLPEGNCLLILGLESTKERNLDEFQQQKGKFHLRGFEKHIAPRMDSLLDFIGSCGYSAKPTGRYGYPRNGELDLKEAAIRAGVGKRGKSTVVLHPTYGPRLRFIGIKTNAPLESLIAPVAEEESLFCRDCSICIDACPVDALQPFHMPDKSICLSNTSVMKEEEGRLTTCDICLHLCPAGGDN